jgi:hypothetical protein
MQKKRRAIDPNELSWTELAQHDPKLLKTKLETRLVEPADVNQLSREITRLLKGLGRRPGTYENVARHIATRLAPRFRHVSVTLERLIANRPVELAAVLQASDWDEYSKIAETISSLPKPKKTRAKQLTEEQRRRSLKASKNRYERRKRRQSLYGETGLIEEEFAIRKRPFLLSDPLNRRPPTGPCLDVLLNLGDVPMSGETYCLESLLGMDRHNFPKSLPHVRRGRHIFYDIRALVKAIVALIEKGKWLPEPDRRNLVLKGIIQRARDIGQPKLATILEQIFSPYLT